MPSRQSLTESGQTATHSWIESLLEPIPVEDLYWSHHTGQFLYSTVHEDDIDGTVAEVIERLEIKLGKV